MTIYEECFCRFFASHEPMPQHERSVNHLFYNHFDTYMILFSNFTFGYVEFMEGVESIKLLHGDDHLFGRIHSTWQLDIDLFCTNLDFYKISDWVVTGAPPATMKKNYTKLLDS